MKKIIKKVICLILGIGLVILIFCGVINQKELLEKGGEFFRSIGENIGNWINSIASGEQNSPIVVNSNGIYIDTGIGNANKNKDDSSQNNSDILDNEENDFQNNSENNLDSNIGDDNESKEE